MPYDITADMPPPTVICIPVEKRYETWLRKELDKSCHRDASFRHPSPLRKDAASDIYSTIATLDKDGRIVGMSCVIRGQEVWRLNTAVCTKPNLPK